MYLVGVVERDQLAPIGAMGGYQRTGLAQRFNADEEDRCQRRWHHRNVADLLVAWNLMVPETACWHSGARVPSAFSTGRPITVRVRADSRYSLKS